MDGKLNRQLPKNSKSNHLIKHPVDFSIFLNYEYIQDSQECIMIQQQESRNYVSLTNIQVFNEVSLVEDVSLHMFIVTKKVLYLIPDRI